MIEEWKSIQETNDYEISNYGRVRSKERIAVKSNGLKHPVKEKILKPGLDNSGYYRCSLMINNKLVTFKVHRLVAKAFCQGFSESRNEVNHINGIKSDNNYKNLEWVNRSENCKHSFDIGIQKPKRGMLNGHSKLKDSDIPKIRQMFKEGMSSREIARIFKMEKSIFLDIRNGKSWSHV